MKLSNREMILGWSTLLIVLGAVLYWIGAGRWEEVRVLARDRAGLARQLRNTERLLGRRGDVDARLAVVRERLPRHAPGKDVTADILRDLENTARAHQVTLTRRDADRERQAGELMEVSVTCTWEADLEGMVRFLYALESQGVMRQVRQMTASPGPDRRLKGNIVADHAYIRGSDDAPAAQPGTN